MPAARSSQAPSHRRTGARRRRGLTPLAQSRRGKSEPSAASTLGSCARRTTRRIARLSTRSMSSENGTQVKRRTERGVPFAVPVLQVAPSPPGELDRPRVERRARARHHLLDPGAAGDELNVGDEGDVGVDGERVSARAEGVSRAKKQGDEVRTEATRPSSRTRRGPRRRSAGVRCRCSAQSQASTARGRCGTRPGGPSPRPRGGPGRETVSVGVSGTAQWLQRTLLPSAIFSSARCSPSSYAILQA